MLDLNDLFHLLVDGVSLTSVMREKAHAAVDQHIEKAPEPEPAPAGAGDQGAVIADLQRQLAALQAKTPAPEGA